ncbi:MAG: hypothetical protein PHF67_00200 [Candidatus Nanoarchaeia archaeon]|nr:hypothetical protein [Candidatus Nanoarchaeia archaeon]
MTRVCLIGPGDVEYHYQELLGFSKGKLDSELEKIAQSLVDSDSELTFLPDGGVSLEVAKKFRALGGKKIIGLVPLSDKHPGIGHLRQYMDTSVDGKPLFDEFIDTGDWAKHDLTMALFGDVVLFLGKSPGTEGERNYGIYMYKIVTGRKKGVKQPIETIHAQARAGKNFPYTIMIYSLFLADKKLSPEDEAYMKKFGINLSYIISPENLKKELKKLL